METFLFRETELRLSAELWPLSSVGLISLPSNDLKSGYVNGSWLTFEFQPLIRMEIFLFRATELRLSAELWPLSF